MVANRVPPPPGTQAVVRALRLLKTFTSERPELSVDEMCETLELTKTTAHRLLKALESEGLVARDRVLNTYHLGSEVIALGLQALLTSDLRAIVRPVLQRIATETGESSSLEVLVGDQMLILDGVKGRHLVSAALEIGTRWPAHATSTGRCIMAALPDASCEYLLSLPMLPYTENTVTDPDVIRDEFPAIRKVGFAVVREELEKDFVAIGAEFRGPMGEVQGAISIGGPISRFPRRRIRSLGLQLRREADALSQRRLPV